MRYVALSTLLAVVVAVSPAAAEECCQAKLKATQDKVAAALASWKEVSTKLAAQCPVERAQIETEFAAAAKTCPVGSRMGKTLAFVRGALAQSIQADEACKAACAKSGETKAAACEQTAALMAARTKLLGDLHLLVSHATGQAPACGKAATETAAAAKGFCPEKAAKLAAAVRGTDCEKEGAAILIKSVEGLKCEKKAAEIAASLRGTACEKEAAAILVKAAGECAAACAKEGKEVAAGKEIAAAAKGFCPEKAAKLAASVRANACEKEGVAILIKGIEGLKCEKKAAEIAASIRGTACEKEAASILVKAAGECAAACAKEGKEVAAKETAAGKVIAAKETAVCKETCAAGGACCKDAQVQACAGSLAAEAKSLKESWAKAREEMASLTAEQRQQFAATVEKLSSRSPAFKAMPQTIQALAEGVETLAGMNGHLLQMAKANPELVKSVPEKAYKNFEAQAGLIRETSEILKLAAGSLCGATSCEKEAKAGKTVSASE